MRIGTGWIVLLACTFYLPPGLFAQPSRPVCEMISDADAAAVIGTIKQKQAILGADHCALTGDGLSLTISRLTDQEPAQIKMLLDLPKNRATPGDVVRDEPGIGQGATSESSKGRLQIIAADGTTVWTFGVNHVYSKDLTDVLPKLRELARQMVSPEPRPAQPRQVTSR